MGAVSFLTVFLQHVHHPTIASPCPSRSWPYCRRLPFAILCASKPFLLPPSNISAATANHDNSGSVSRREAVAAIVLLLQSLQIAVALGGNAHALDDSSTPGLRSGSDSAEVETNQILELARLDGGGPTLLPKSVFEADLKKRRVIATSKQQFQTASMGLMKSSGSSLGLLGGMICGFLFLRERLARTASDNLLEDVHTRTRKADTELLSRTRSTLRLKSENSQVSNQARKGVLQNEASLYQVMSIKSDVIKLEEELHAQRNTFQALKHKENSLKGGLEKLEKDCRCLTEELNSKLECGQILKAQLQNKSFLLQSEENEIKSLKMILEDHKKLVTECIQEENGLEIVLDQAKSNIQNVEENISRSSKRLCDELEFVQSMTEELTAVTSRNEICDEKLNELHKNLQEARQIFLAEMAHLKNVSSLKEQEAYTRSSELMTENGEVEASLETLRKLISEKENLNKVSMDKTDILNNMKEQLDATRKQLERYDVERATLHDALSNELARLPVEEQCEIDGTLLQHTGISGEVEGDIDRKMSGEAAFSSKESASTTILAQELLEAEEALRASKDKVLSSQDIVKLYLTQEAQLEEDLVALGEKRQGYSIAVRKEKRASTYAKKKLALCEENLAGETATMQGLCKDLELAKQHLQDLKDQWTMWAHEMEIANSRALCLEEEISSLKVHIDNERIARKEMEKHTKKVTSTPSRPVATKRMSKSNAVKSNKKHLPQPLDHNAASDDALDTAAVS